jgi:hypothetical protein
MNMPAAAIHGSAAAAVMAPAPRAPGRPTAYRDHAAASACWQAWRARFGLAEVCGTAAAAGGFAAGYLPAGSLLAAAGLATICEIIGFYGCIAAKTVAAASRATAHLGGWRRLAAGAGHAVREQLASCAIAEAVDAVLIRPGCLAGAAWLLRPLPGGVWLGFAAGKAVADVAWYGMEASARRGVAWSAATAKLTAKLAPAYLELHPARGPRCVPRPPSESPWLAVAGEVGQRVDVLGLVDVPRRGGEGGVGPDPDHDPVLLAGHALDLGQLGG